MRPEIEQIRASLFSIAEFCLAVRMSRRQYHRLKAEGRGPRETRLGGSIFIQRHEITRWLNSNTGR